MTAPLDWHELHPIVDTTVRRHVRDSGEAEDTVQDVLVELWLKRDRFDDAAGTPGGWATTVARRRAIDRVRSSTARTAREESFERERPRFVQLVSEEVMVRLDRSRLLDALDILNPPQREAIVLAYFGDRSYAEVARLLQIPEGTAKRRIRDGMARLRARLGER